MSFVFIDRFEDAGRLAESLARGGPIALDCEAAGFHRYSDRLCLLQITTSDAVDYIVDPLAFDVTPLLRGPLEDPAVRTLMHGSDYDLRLLDRDLSIRLQGLVDTQAAAALLGENALGLAALLDKFLGIRLEKKYQRADWAMRPLTADMLDYAASDTRHLPALVGRLEVELERLGRTAWAVEEFAELQRIRWEDDGGVDPVTRVKGARDLPARSVARLREALAWRDDIARTLDRAAFRIASDQVLIDLALNPPADVPSLGRTKGMNPRLAHEEGERLLARFAVVDALPDAEVPGYPRRERGNGPGRPPPEIEEVAERLKGVRNRRADELGLARGTLLPNAALVEIARLQPRSPEALREIPGIKGWQVDAVGEALLAGLARK